MIPMLKCLFCKRKRRLFKIYKIYGRTERPITSYIVNFFGDVEDYLKEDHGICSTCVFLLNKLIYIKNYMFKQIIEDSINKDAPYVSFAMAYKLFLHNLDKLNFDDVEVVEEENFFDLLKPIRSMPCESDYEYSSDRNTPYVDKEVETVFKKARRKRRRSTIEDDDGASTPLLRYDKDGRLLNKRTRSVSRMLNAMQEEIEEEHKERSCKCVDCERKIEYSKSERENVSHHELLAKHWCYECRSGKFTSLDDFVHLKASEEMTTLYRVDYNGTTENPICHISQNTTGDFNVKLLVQAGKLGESPTLQFHDSPDITSSEGTDIGRVSVNSVETNTPISDGNLYDTGQEELSSETCNIVNRSTTPSSVVSFRESVGEGEEKGVLEEERELISDRGSIEGQNLVEQVEEEEESTPSAFEPERIVCDIQSSSEFESSPLSSNDECEGENYELSKKELRVVLERVNINNDHLKSLELQRKSPKTPTIEYMTRRRSNYSRNSSCIGSEVETIGIDLFRDRSISPGKANRSVSTESVQSSSHLKQNSTFESSVYPVRTDIETDTNDSE